MMSSNSLETESYISYADDKKEEVSSDRDHSYSSGTYDAADDNDDDDDEIDAQDEVRCASSGSHPRGTVLFRQVYEAELLSGATDYEYGKLPPLGLRIGGGTPTQGTRQRIRARVSAKLDGEFSNVAISGVEEETDGLFITGVGASDDLGSIENGILGFPDRDIQRLRETVWMPQGPDVCPPHILKMSYHLAWDVGKRGCIGLKLNRGEWEGTVNPNRLRFFIMDGTDPIAFLSYYAKSDLRDGRADYQKKGIINVSELRNGSWTFSHGRVRLAPSRGARRRVTIDRLPPHFLEAMIICIREMEVVAAVTRFRLERAASAAAAAEQVKPNGSGANRRGSLSVGDGERKLVGAGRAGPAALRAAVATVSGVLRPSRAMIPPDGKVLRVAMEGRQRHSVFQQM